MREKMLRARELRLRERIDVLQDELEQMRVERASELQAVTEHTRLVHRAEVDKLEHDLGRARERADRYRKLAYRMRQIVTALQRKSLLTHEIELAVKRFEYQDDRRKK